MERKKERTIERQSDLHRYLRFAICNLWSFVVWPSFISLCRTNSNDLPCVFHSIPCANDCRFYWPFPCDLLLSVCNVCECDLSLQEKYKRKREWIQCTNRESTPESQVHIIACHIIELFSIPPLFFAWFVTFIKCKCAIYHAHTQTHTLVWHRELRCIPMKWKMVTNSSSSINFLRFFRCSRTVSSVFWVMEQVSIFVHWNLCLRKGSAMTFFGFKRFSITILQ